MITTNTITYYPRFFSYFAELKQLCADINKMPAQERAQHAQPGMCCAFVHENASAVLIAARTEEARVAFAKFGLCIGEIKPSKLHDMFITLRRAADVVPSADDTSSYGGF